MKEMGNTNSYILVKCKDCNLKFQKRSDSIKVWGGRCRSCAQRTARADPIFKAKQSERARQQVLRQGGIPNARKFQAGSFREQHPRWKGGLPSCRECNKTLSTRTSRYCSQCVKQHYPKGVNHHNWKGGVSGKNRAVRASPLYKQWRMAVFRRDRFSCVICGYRSSHSKNKRCDIRADHIKPFHLFPELQLELLNGRTLCIPCDRAYGYNYNRERGLINRTT